jgi:hypothetical protein
MPKQPTYLQYYGAIQKCIESMDEVAEIMANFIERVDKLGDIIGKLDEGAWE